MPRVTDNPTYGARNLYLGCPKGLDIWNLQVKLIGWGSGSDNDGVGNTMDPVRLTGDFDSTTRDAVLRFQLAHKLPATGMVDGCMFRAIDREAALHPVLINDLKCPCVRGDNDGPILCRCTGDDGNTPPRPVAHPYEGKCTGFGKALYAGTFLLDGKTLADGTSIADEKLDVYDRQEYAGMDKTVLWAVRAILDRTKMQTEASFKNARISAGYRCWHDNYHYTDLTRWHHRQTTFHFGKTISFTISGYCTEPVWKDNVDDCPQCKILRKTALEKCGFQSRWHEPGRVSLAEGPKTARPPSSPFAVNVDAVRLHERNGDGSLNYTDHFVNTDLDAVKPLYGGALAGVAFPMIQTSGVTVDSAPIQIKLALDPKFASSETFFRNTETGNGGYFPLGKSRLWHGGVHLNAAPGAAVFAIADGDIVGCRMGDPEEQANGSRNFVLLRHEIKKAGAWKDKVFYSLYMHLDAEEAKADAKVRWRRELFQRTKDHVEASAPAPFFDVAQIDGKDRLVPKPGFGAGDVVAVTGGEVAANTIDDSLPAAWKMYALAPPGTGYVFTTREGQTMGTKLAALTGVTAGAVIGLAKPIRVCAGERLGGVSKAAPDCDTYLHLETFAEAALPAAGVVSVTADSAKMAEMKAIVAKLTTGANLLPQTQDGVLTAAEVKKIYSSPPYYAQLRSAEIKMPSAWSLDWQAALSGATSLGFLDDPSSLGGEWKKFQWWDDVKSGNGQLPADPTAIYHYHPIALILQIAYL